MAVTIPEDVRDLFDEPALAHVSYFNKKGQIVTLPMWVDFDGEHILRTPHATRGLHDRDRPHQPLGRVGAALTPD